MDIEIGIDIGGTFTDVVCRQPEKGVRILKVPTTREDPSRAVISAIERMSKDWGVQPGAIRRFVHGTTVATNAVLERSAPKIGLLTTRGFKDIIEIGRQMRTQMYSVVLRPETPVFLASGAMRREVRERLSAAGGVVEPLDEASVREAAAELVSAGAKGIAICFLHSFLNPAHERRAAAIVRETYPGIFISVSCDVDPAFREYERTVVTAFDAYIKPVVDKYLGNLEAGLLKAKVTAPLQVMQSRGGIAASAAVRQRPVRLFLSGPAAGVIGGRMVGAEIGEEDLITVDIGGTSSDIALIHAGKPLIRADGLVDGFPIRVPMVDVNAIGAGGGSIAWIDPAGGLRVGPRSAGSEPGPACYGQGGELATVTDASLVLGYIDPDYFAGGTIRLDPGLARRVIEEKVARPLGLSVEDAALGIHRVVNTQMTEGIRLVSIRQGFDPRRFVLVPLGGGGGLHATALADELGITRIAIPRYPGVLSAVGLLASDVEHEASTAFPAPLAGLRLAEIETVLQELDVRCGALMQHEGISRDKIQRTYFADVCYVGQTHYLEVPIRLTEGDPISQIYRDFVQVHDRVFGHSTDSPARLVNLRAVHLSHPPSGAALQAEDRRGVKPIKGKRMVTLLDTGRAESVSVYDRDCIEPECSIIGPAIIEQADTTTLVGRGWHAKPVEGSILLLSRNGSHS